MLKIRCAFVYVVRIVVVYRANTCMIIFYSDVSCIYIVLCIRFLDVVNISSTHVTFDKPTCIH